MNITAPSHATKAALLVALLALLIIGGIAINYWMTLSVISHSQSQWCDTLDLLTSHAIPKPVNPSENPSRVGQYELYEDFVALRNKFDCKGES